MRLLKVSLLLGASIASAACASRPAATSASGTTTTAPARRQRNVITAAELATVDVATVYEAIQRLRPEMLRVATSQQTTGGLGSTPNGEVVVFMDDSRLGGAATLSQISPREVREIRYLTPSEASTRFGSGLTNGAILLLRKR